MDYVWDACYAAGLTSSPSVASIPIFPKQCQRDLHQYYEVDPRIIGRGSFALVHRVKLRRRPNHHPSEDHNDNNSDNNQSALSVSNSALFDSYYACKTISKSKLYDRELFRQEIYNLNRCQTIASTTTTINTNRDAVRQNNNHHHIIRLLDVLEDRSSVHIVTELCEGGELFDYIAKEHDRTGRGLRGKPLSPTSSHGDDDGGDETRCARIVCQILIAFSFLHEEAAVCHRDLKASNFVFVTNPSFESDSLNLRVIDFGLSKFVRQSQQEEPVPKNDETVITSTPSSSAKTFIVDLITRGFIQLVFWIWSTIKENYFPTILAERARTKVAVKMPKSEEETDDESSRLLGNAGKDHTRLEFTAEIHPTSATSTNVTEGAYDTGDNCDEGLYSKHYRYMTSEVGTPYYVAPEVLTQKEQVKVGYSTKCDIWSIGVLAFLTLTGTFPVIGTDERETILKLMDPNLRIDFSDAAVWEPDAQGTNGDNGNTTGTIKKRRISNAARSFCEALLQRDPTKRPTAREALQFDWIVTHCGEPDAAPISSTEGAHCCRHSCRLPSLSTSIRDDNERK